jgi:hypothetical protein
MTARRAPNGRCAVCCLIERQRAELLLAGGASIQSVARKHKVNYHALRRHWMNHVPDERKRRLVLGPVSAAALAARVADESTSVLDHLKTVRAGLYEMFDAALAAGDRNGGALLAGRLHENLHALARLTGELASSPLVMTQNNIFVSPQFAELQAVLIRVLAEFPAARARVIQEFRSLEAKTDSPRQIEHGNGQAA